MLLLGDDGNVNQRGDGFPTISPPRNPVDAAGTGEFLIANPGDPHGWMPSDSTGTFAFLVRPPDSPLTTYSLHEFKQSFGPLIKMNARDEPPMSEADLKQLFNTFDTNEDQQLGGEEVEALKKVLLQKRAEKQLADKAAQARQPISQLQFEQRYSWWFRDGLSAADAFAAVDIDGSKSLDEQELKIGLPNVLDQERMQTAQDAMQQGRQQRRGHGVSGGDSRDL